MPLASGAEGGQRLLSTRHQLFIYFLLFPCYRKKKKKKSVSSEAGRAGTQTDMVSSLLTSNAPKGCSGAKRSCHLSRRDVKRAGCQRPANI